MLVDFKWMYCQSFLAVRRRFSCSGENVRPSLSRELCHLIKIIYIWERKFLPVCLVLGMRLAPTSKRPALYLHITNGSIRGNWGGKRYHKNIYIYIHPSIHLLYLEEIRLKQRWEEQGRWKISTASEKDTHGQTGVRNIQAWQVKSTDGARACVTLFFWFCIGR